MPKLVKGRTLKVLGHRPCGFDFHFWHHFILGISMTTQYADWQQRVIAERDEVQERLSKLEPFLDSINFTNLDADNQDLLVEQAHIMDEYVNVLNRRIALFE
jgi:hypothetical protein